MQTDICVNPCTMRRPGDDICVVLLLPEGNYVTLKSESHLSYRVNLLVAERKAIAKLISYWEILIGCYQCINVSFLNVTW